MNNVKAAVETGGFHVEFNGIYLGSGKLGLVLQGAVHELRRDELHSIRSRPLKSVDMILVAELSAGDRFWEHICSTFQQAESLFSQGGVLKLYPEDTSRAGYEFKRVFLEKAEHISGGRGQNGKLKLSFSGEAVGSSGLLMNRLGAGLLPAGAEKSTPVGVPEITDALMDLLAGLLDAVIDQTLCFNFLPPGRNGGYLLEIKRCRNWNSQGPLGLDYALTAHFPAVEKNTIDQKLIVLAEELHGSRVSAGGNRSAVILVESLELGRWKSSGCKLMTDSCLDFTIFIE